MTLTFLKRTGQLAYKTSLNLGSFIQCFCVAGSQLSPRERLSINVLGPLLLLLISDYPISLATILWAPNSPRSLLPYFSHNCERFVPIINPLSPTTQSASASQTDGQTDLKVAAGQKLANLGDRWIILTLLCRIQIFNIILKWNILRNESQENECC